MTAKDFVQSIRPTARLEVQHTNGGERYCLIRERNHYFYMASGKNANEAWKNAKAFLQAKIATGKKYTASEEVVKKYSNKKVETVVNPVTPDFANNNDEVDAALKSGKITLHTLDMMDAKGINYGQVITIKGSQYKVTGYNQNASKNPVIITAVKSGKEYNASLQMIKG